MKRILYALGALLSGSITVWLLLDLSVAYRVCDAFLSFLSLMTGGVDWQQNAFVSHGCLLAAIAAPAALCSGLCLLIPKERSHAYALSTIVSLLPLAVVLMVVWTNVSVLIHFYGALIGGFGCLLCVWLYHWLTDKFPKIFNRETVSYIIFGVLTTVVSFVSQMLFASLGWHVTINTVGSWVCAVLFAYVVNKLFVFESKTSSAKAFWRELCLFIAARLASLGMELVFMYITVDWLGYSEAICKLIAQVFILIANYVLSKLIIFKKQ